jgi:hypothetical protein
MVIVPTALGFLFALSPENKQTEEAIGAMVGVFLFTSFPAGGALTLVQIANNTKGCMDALQALRYMRSEWQGGEWRSLFVAGIDSASTVQQLNR